jgi:RNA 2',3'-cyclic 3'-phosphodiesterase
MESGSICLLDQFGNIELDYLRMRLFVGIPLADAVAAELAEVAARWRSAADSLRWAAPESWHITLQFLGNAGPEQYNCLTARLRELRSPPVPIRLTTLGIFERTGIVFAGVDLAPALVSLQQRIVAATALCGFQPEDRPFHPHITLARSKGRSGARQLAALMAKLRVQPEFTPFTAREVLLYQSHLGPSGSNYEVRARFPLAG